MEEAPDVAAARAHVAKELEHFDKIQKKRREAERELKAFRLAAEQEKEATRRRAADARDRRSTRSGRDAEVIAENAVLNLKLEVSEHEKNRAMSRQSTDVRGIVREKVATREIVELKKEMNTTVGKHEAMLNDTLKQLAQAQRFNTQGEHKQVEAKEDIASLRATQTSLIAKLETRDATIVELRAKIKREYDRDRACSREHLVQRSTELQSLRSAEARRGIPHRSGTPQPRSGTPASSGRATPTVPGSGRDTPVQPSTVYNKMGIDPRRESKAVEHIGEHISAAGVEVLARTLAETGKLDELMTTAPFWQRRMTQAQELVDICNEKWDVNLSCRIKQDWLNSDRHLDGMRLMFSHFIPKREETDEGRPPRPHHSVLLRNPHPSARGAKQVVFFPEPIKPRAGEAGWSKVIETQNTEFGLEINRLHPNCTQRNFNSVLQEIVTRDEALLSDVDSLRVVVGLDGFDSYCHVLLRLVDYKEGTAKESELKGSGLAVAVGDDHNPNLDLIFGDGLGEQINSAIVNGATVQLRGRAVPIELLGCFDLSAARSVKARRTNASP